MAVPIPVLLLQTNSFLALVSAKHSFAEGVCLNCTSHVGMHLKEMWHMMLCSTAYSISLGLYWLGKLLIILMSSLPFLKYCATYK